MCNNTKQVTSLLALCARRMTCDRAWKAAVKEVQELHVDPPQSTFPPPTEVHTCKLLLIRSFLTLVEQEQQQQQPKESRPSEAKH